MARENNQIAVVTGSNTGVGLAVAKRLLAEAAKASLSLTIVLACRNPDKAKCARQEILDMFPNAIVEMLALDTSDLASVVAAAKEVKERYGRVDYLYLNAGIMPVKAMHINWSALLSTDIRHIMHVLATSEGLLAQEDWKLKNGLNAVFTTNLLGHFLLIQELEDMLVGNRGRIVWTGSNAANKKSYSIDNVQHENGTDPYGASKYALDTLNKALNERLNPKGVYAYTCCPGVVLTGVTYGIMPQWIWFFFMLPLMALMRIVEPSYTLSPYNGAEGLVMLSGISKAKEPNVVVEMGKLEGAGSSSHADPNVKYYSRVSVLGRRYVTFKETEGTIEEGRALYTALATMTKQYRK